MPKISPFSITIATTAAVFCLGFQFGVVPQLRALGKAQAESEAYRNQPIVKRSISASGISADDTRTLVDALLPKTDNQYDLSVQVEALAKRSGVSLTSLTITAIEPVKAAPNTTVSAQAGQIAGLSGSMRKLNIGVGISGTYEQTQSFVIGLTGIDRFVQLDQVAVTNSAAASGGDGVVSITVSGYAYYLPAATPAK